MENVAVIGSGSTIGFKDRIVSLFKNRGKEERAREIDRAKDRFEISHEYLKRPVDLQDALINAGPIMFIGSPLKSSELEEILYTIVVYNPKFPGEVKLPEYRKYGKWEKFLNEIDNPKAKEFFVVEKEELRLSFEGLSYVNRIINSYTHKDALA